MSSRADQILAAGVELASRVGYQRLTRGQVAEAAGCSVPLISVYFLSAELMREMILTEAVRTGCLPVIAEGLAVGDPIALAAPVEVQQRAALSLLPR